MEARRRHTLATFFREQVMSGELIIDRRHETRSRQSSVDRITRQLDVSNPVKLAGILAMLIDVADDYDLQRIADTVDSGRK
jgi:hypothetical protein